MDDNDSFTPMWASPPGRTIQKRLDELGFDVSEFAKQLGVSVQVANGLLDGNEMITIDIARRLSSLIGASAEFWISRDCQYRDDLVRVETDQWLADLPVKAMAKFGWIAPEPGWASQVNACLSFFGVEDVEAWRTTYEPMLAASRLRISAAVPARRYAVAAWLRKAACEAETVATSPWSAPTLRDSLDAVKKLTWSKNPGDFIPKLQGLLARAGVALVIIRALPGCPASGAARFLSADRAMIVVSGRFLADDQFWFTVVHEIGHLILHEPDHAILDDPYLHGDLDSQEELEANRFAADTLLPARVRMQVPAGAVTYRNVISLALAAGVSPGIVVGQLQFEGRIPRDHLNRLKRRYKWSGSNLEIA
jgi:HTH-type transcriptional regulator / antitoxin HigA